jgi:hypothetical protein
MNAMVAHGFNAATALPAVGRTLTTSSSSTTMAAKCGNNTSRLAIARLRLHTDGTIRYGNDGRD